MVCSSPTVKIVEDSSFQCCNSVFLEDRFSVCFSEYTKKFNSVSNKSHKVLRLGSTTGVKLQSSPFLL